MGRSRHLCWKIPLVLFSMLGLLESRFCVCGLELFRYVPISLLRDVSRMAGHCAHVSNVAGLPLISLKALAVAGAVQLLVPDDDRMGEHTLERWRTRLVAEIMTRHLPSPQVCVQQLDSCNLNCGI